MSTDYATLRKISAEELFNGCLEAHGVCEHTDFMFSTDKMRCLTDGRNGLFVYVNDKGRVSSLSRTASCGDPGKILEAIARVFDTDIVSEDDPRYWGFDTQEEWDAYMAQISKETRDRDRAELLKFLLGEPNDIRPGTGAMERAEIAKELVAKNPALLLPKNEVRFRSELNTIYDRRHMGEIPF
jgi:hypothetical protein